MQKAIAQHFDAAADWARKRILDVTPDKKLGASAIVVKYARRALENSQDFLGAVRTAENMLSETDTMLVKAGRSSEEYVNSPAVAGFSDNLLWAKHRYSSAIQTLQSSLQENDRADRTLSLHPRFSPVDKSRLNALNEVRLAQENIADVMKGKLDAEVKATGLFVTDREEVLGRKAVTPNKAMEQANFHDLMESVTPSIDLPSWHRSIRNLTLSHG